MSDFYFLKCTFSTPLNSLLQASPTIIEIQDSTTECEEEARPGLLQMEEKVFVSSLHSFMKDRGTPIERIPHLGFKQSEFIDACTLHARHSKANSVLMCDFSTYS